MTIAQLFRVLIARWLLIAIAGMTGVLLALGWALASHKIYRSTAEVIVNVRAPETVGSQTMADQLSPDYLSTQMDVIRSDRVALLAVQRLNLASNPQIGFELGWSPADGPLDRFIAQNLAKNLRIESGSALSRVIDISYSAVNPSFAAAVANAFAQAYIDANLDLQAQPARESAAWYERRSRELQKQLAAAQAKLTGRQQALGVAATVGSPDDEEQRLQALSAQLAAAQAQSAAVSARSQEGALPDTLTNPVIQNLQSEISKLEAQRQQLATIAGPNNPDYRQVVAQLAALREQLARQSSLIQRGASTAAVQANSGVGQLEAEVAVQKKRVIASHARTDEVGVLQQDVRNLQAVYDQMAARRSQLDLLGESTQSNVAVLSPAAPADAPVWPRPLWMVILGLAIGTTVGMALAIGSELIDQRVRDINDFDVWLGIPNLGSIRMGGAATPRLSGRIGRFLPYRGAEQNDE